MLARSFTRRILVARFYSFHDRIVFGRGSRRQWTKVEREHAPGGVGRRPCTVFVTNPIAASLLALGLICVILALLPSIRSKRDQVFVEDD